MSNRQKAGALLILLLLIPILLTDPLDWPERIEQVPAPTASPALHGPVAKGEPALRFQSWSDPSFDREAFLASFRRQSAMGLRDCLTGENLKERAFSATATLTRKGQLNHLRWNNEEALPKCVVATIQAMNFFDQSERLSYPSIELEWRVDW